jgi:[ribosomal protein S5]-alanine N-acetyltransferase
MSYFLTTKRLGFRTWTEEDLPLALALWTDPEVMRHMGGPGSAEAIAERLQVETQRQRTFGIQYWPIFERKTGVHAGCAGLRPYHDRDDVLEVGVHIARSFWSGRYGEEAARAVIAYGFEKVGARELVAGHGPENVHSKALIERLGFVYTHAEPWGKQNILHPFYKLERPLA